MYRLLLILGLLLIYYGSPAQTYHAFPTSDAAWTMNSYTFGGFPPHSFSLFRYQLSGDTTINNKQYSLIEYDDFDAGTNTSYVGGIREDSSKKVWFYSFGLPLACTPTYASDSVYRIGEETLIFDFGLSVGDSVEHAIIMRLDGNGVVFIDSASSHVIAIDSIPLLDGTYRKALRIRTIHNNNSPWQNPEVGTWWVEGIGTLQEFNLQNLGINLSHNYAPILHSGLFASLSSNVPGSSPPGCASEITCYSHNGVQLLGLNGVASCDTVVSTASIEQQPLSQVLVYPNPFDQTTRIEVNQVQFQQIQVRIFNTMGQLVEQKTTSSHFIQIEKQNIPTGIYLYQVWADEQFIASGKLISK